MTLFLILLIAAAMLATLFMLVRGLVNMAGTTTAELEGEGPSPRAMQSNKLMQGRIIFQAIAIALIALFLLLFSAKG